MQLVRRAPDGATTTCCPRVPRPAPGCTSTGAAPGRSTRRLGLFANWADQRLYRMRVGGAPEPLTPEPAVPMGLRYADLLVAGPYVVCVRESHLDAGREARNEIVAVPIDGGDAIVLVSGPDFVSSPRSRPSGEVLAWLQWDHPRMPWDGTELYWRRSCSRSAPRRGPRNCSWPAATTRPSACRRGHPTGCCTSARTATAGGTSTGCIRRAARRPRSPASTPRSACPPGSSASRRYGFLDGTASCSPLVPTASTGSAWSRPTAPSRSSAAGFTSIDHLVTSGSAADRRRRLVRLGAVDRPPRRSPRAGRRPRRPRCSAPHATSASMTA